MLVLSRKPQQEIMIPGLNIRITVLRIGGNRVQLGIDAPPGIQITRPELNRWSGNPWEENVNADGQICPIQPVLSKPTHRLRPDLATSENPGQEKVYVD